MARREVCNASYDASRCEVRFRECRATGVGRQLRMNVRNRGVSVTFALARLPTYSRRVALANAVERLVTGRDGLRMEVALRDASLSDLTQWRNNESSPYQT